MIEPGEVYLADLREAGHRPVTFTVTNPTNTIVWTLFSVTFQATAPNTIIALRNFDSPSQTFSLIDNVSVTPVLDSDGDGVPDDEDACLDSTLSTSVVIDNCDSGVGNQLFDDGCTITDLIAECAKGASNHGQFVSCVSHLTNDLKKAGAITGQQKGAIQSCAAQADIR